MNVLSVTCAIKIPYFRKLQLALIEVFQIKRTCIKTNLKENYSSVRKSNHRETGNLKMGEINANNK